MSKALIRKSESVYNFFLKFYPKRHRQEFGEEMKYVFSESLKDAYRENGDQGIFRFWAHAIVDIGKTLAIEHLEHEKEGGKMKNKRTDIIMQNKIFLWLAAGTAGLLSIPYLAMQFNWVKPDPANPLDQGVNWTLGDFIVMGILLFGTGTFFVAVARVTPRKYRLLVGLAVLAIFLATWAHLAVGLVDTWPLAGS